MDASGTPDLRKDLEATVRELSDTYEELSLLYKLSDILSGMTLDEIAEEVIENATDTLEIETAALLFYDDQNMRLFTKCCRGAWVVETTVSPADEIVWAALAKRKTMAFCNLPEAGYTDYPLAKRSILACPLIGKKRDIGVLVLADRESADEFYSNDIKLIMAICSQAALAIENALLLKEIEDFLLSAIRSLMKALEASSYWTAGHTERVTTYACGIGKHMGLKGKELERLRICALLHDIGKIAIPKEILDKREQLEELELIEIKKHPLIGAEILGEFAQLSDVIQGIKHHHEWWDGGNSILGLKGSDIPLMARILSVADAFDAMTSDRPYRKKKSSTEAVEEILVCSGTQFDPSVVSAFRQWVSRQHQVFSP